MGRMLAPRPPGRSDVRGTVRAEWLVIALLALAVVAMYLRLQSGCAGGGVRIPAADAGVAAVDAPLLPASSWHVFNDAEVAAADEALSFLTVNIPAWVFAAAPRELKPVTAQQVAAVGVAANRKSQDGEDLYAYEHFFKGKAGGLVLETGGFTGLELSNSYMFERALGWRAVHVEASPVSFQLLQANRPGSLNINAAICDAPRMVHYALPPSATDASTVSGIWEFMSPEFKLSWYPDATQAEAAGHPLPAEFKRLTCVPLTPLLGLFGITHIDVWFLDVEGAEWQVLQTLDLSVVTVDVIVIESDGTDQDKQRNIDGFLQGHGYRLHGDKLRSLWYVRKEAETARGFARR